jgi:TolB-like protein
VFRIGINVGDIIIDGDDIYGDGVNIAARLQTLAEPGSICVSRVVRDQVQDKLNVSFEDLGAQEVKNIARPVEVYRLGLGDEPLARPGPPALPRAPPLRWATWGVAMAALVAAVTLTFLWWSSHRSATPPPLAMSVAVLPFANLSDDRDNEYFSDGISEELLTVLQKIPGLRIAARLSRAATGQQLWSDGYTRNLSDVFAVQSELAQTIVEQLRGQLGGAANASAHAEIQAQVLAAMRGGTKDAEAYQHYLRGLYLLNQFSPDSAVKATDSLRRAVTLDPAFALGWATLSRAGALRAGVGDSKGDFNEGLALAREAANRALALAPDLPSAHLARMRVQAWYDFDWKGAAESLRRAQEVAPTDSEVVAAAAQLAYASGQRDNAIALARQATGIDPANDRAQPRRACWAR